MKQAQVLPAGEEPAFGQVIWSPLAQGIRTGKDQPAAAFPEGSRATDAKGGATMVARWLCDDVLECVHLLAPWPRRTASPRHNSASPGPC